MVGAVAAPAIRILIADDHPLMRAALKEALRMRLGNVEIVEAETVAALDTEMAEGGGVDVVLLDLRMPDSKGFFALVQLRTRFPEVPVVVVSATEDADTVNRAILLGASGYILKSAPVEIVGDTVRDVLEGKIVHPAGRPTDAASEREESQFRKLRTLTPQQFNVLVMIGEGHSNKTVANLMQISESTVKAHLTAILLKLDLQRRTQAALLAQRALEMDGGSARESFA